MRLDIRLLLIGVVATLASGAGFAQTYYVDKSHPSASDENPGVDRNLPWRSLEQAAKSLEPGDTVVVGGGVYSEPMLGYTPDSGVAAIVKPQRSGTAEKPIVYKAEDGSNVVLEPGAAHGFYIAGKDHITIDGFEIRKGEAGITVASGFGRMVGIRIVNNYVHHISSSIANGSGIRIDAVDSAYVGNNLIHNISNLGVENNNGMCILSYTMLNVVIENIECHTADKGVYHKIPYTNNDGGIVIKNNFIHGTNSALEFNNNEKTGSSHRGTKIHNNIFVDNGKFIYDTTYQSEYENIDFEVYNNTVVNSGGLSIRGLSDLKFFNNILKGSPERMIETVYQDEVFSNSQNRKAPSIGLSDYNLFDRSFSARLGLYSGKAIDFFDLGEWQTLDLSRTDGVSIESSAIPLDVNSIVGVSGFRNASVHDYRLDVSSPAMNAGKGGVHIGAYAKNSEVIGLRPGFRHTAKNSITPLSDSYPPTSIQLNVQ